jgi:hypothetical protein
VPKSFVPSKPERGQPLRRPFSLAASHRLFTLGKEAVLKSKHLQKIPIIALMLLAACASTSPTQNVLGDRAADQRGELTQSTIVRHGPRGSAPSSKPLLTVTVQEKAPGRQAAALAEAAKRLKQKRFNDAVNQAVDFEISGQRLTAIRAYRTASIYANDDQRDDLESRARELLIEHLNLEKKKDLLSARQTEPPLGAEFQALADLTELTEIQLRAVLKTTTPTERLRAATAGYNSFLAQSTASYGQTAKAREAAQIRLRQFRVNEAHLARFRKRQRLLREQLKSAYKEAIYSALKSARSRFQTRDYMALFTLLEGHREQLAQSAKIVYRARTFTRSLNSPRGVAVGFTVKPRAINRGEAQQLFKAHHKLQLAAINQSQSLTPENILLLLRGENLRQQRILTTEINNAVIQRKSLSLHDLIYALQNTP